MKKLFIACFCFFPLLIIAQVGINKTDPEATLDINGNLIIRNIPVDVDGGTFNSIVVDDKGMVMRLQEDPASFNMYLGFDPVADSHEATLPFKLEEGYMSRMIGSGVGACRGVLINFTIFFIGKKYIGANLQAISTASTNEYAAVTLGPNSNVFGTSLERLAKANCGNTTGHTLTNDDGIISVKFVDSPKYFPNAGKFIVYSFDKFRIY